MVFLCVFCQVCACCMHTESPSPDAETSPGLSEWSLAKFDPAFLLTPVEIAERVRIDRICVERDELWQRAAQLYLIGAMEIICELDDKYFWNLLCSEIIPECAKRSEKERFDFACWTKDTEVSLRFYLGMYVVSRKPHLCVLKVPGLVIDGRQLMSERTIPLF